MVYVCILISQNTVFLTGRLTIGKDCLSCFAGPSQAYLKKKKLKSPLYIRLANILLVITLGMLELNTSCIATMPN